MKKALKQVNNRIGDPLKKEMDFAANISNISANKTALSNNANTSNSRVLKEPIVSFQPVSKSHKRSRKRKETANLEDEEMPSIHIEEKKKEYFNKLSLERMNFLFKEYHDYADSVMQPSVFFFKFLAYKQEKESEIERSKTLNS